MPAGQKLKVLRNVRNITVREVEQASRRIAEAKGDKRFQISNGWLAQLEKGVSEPSICKLFSLSVSPDSRGKNGAEGWVEPLEEDIYRHG